MISLTIPMTAMKRWHWVFLFAAGVSAAVAGPATEALDNGLAAARKQSKAVFLLYGFPQCAPCRVFEKYLATLEVKEIFDRHLVIVDIDVVNMSDGQALQDKIGPQGAPAWAFLDADGKVLCDSDDGRGDVGYPSGPRGVAQYVKALKTARPGLSESAIQTLTAQLARVEGSPVSTSTGETNRFPSAPSGGAAQPPATANHDADVARLSLLNSPNAMADELQDSRRRALLESAFEGTWTNRDAATQSLPQLEFFSQGGRFMFRPWGVQSRGAVALDSVPLYFLERNDSGTNAAGFAAIRLVFMTTTYTFQVVGPELRLEEVGIFTDRSGRPNYLAHEVFRKK